MDARDRLREYLEQRRELGERELVLDDLSIADAMRLLGVRDVPELPSQGSRPASEADTAAHQITERSAAGPDWRAALRSIGAEKPGAPVASGEGHIDAPAHESGPPREKLRRLEPPPPSRSRPERIGRFDMPTETSEPIGEGFPAPGTAGKADVPLRPGLVVGSPMGDLLGGPLDHLDSIEAVAKAVASCTACPLHETAKNPVPGEGDQHAGLVCVGEAPGATEDETGRPFVGQAGQLLTKILAAIGFARDDVFICNVLKHRPPGNRNPAPEEIRVCTPFLLRQLELLEPRVILALGTCAAQTLLQTAQPIGKLRGQVHRLYGVPLIVTYHPAALLRNPSWKRPTWEDVQLARRVYDSAVSGA